MRRLFLFTLLLILREFVDFIMVVEAGNDDEFYTAAVVEFSLPTASDSTRGNIEESLTDYLRLINEASEKDADIVVFPEGSLNYYGMAKATRKKLLKHAVELSDSDIHNSTSFNNFCDYSKLSSSSKIISTISFIARKNKIYVLINAIEKIKCQNVQWCQTDRKESGKVDRDGDYLLYSTNFVFDRNGCVISRYRKFNVKSDALLNSTKLPEVQIFHTDFGVTFGHFISSDIFSKYPAYIMLQHGIQHILHPTSLPSSLPFHTSLQVQQSYSFANDIVLLSSSISSPKDGLGGSGIYMGRSGPVAMLLSPETTQQLIMSRIPKSIDTYSIEIVDNVVKRFTPRQLNDFNVGRNHVDKTWKLPTKTWEVERWCRGKICCEFSVQYHQINEDFKKNGLSYIYKLTASSSSSSSPSSSSLEIESGTSCAIVACTSDLKESCGKRFSSSEDVDIVASLKFTEIHVKMIVEVETSEHDYLVMPTSADFSLLPLDIRQYEFESSAVYSVNRKHFINYTKSLKSPAENLLTFGIYGQIFHIREFNNEDEEDMFNDESENVDLISIVISLLIGLFMMFATLKFMSRK